MGFDSVVEFGSNANGRLSCDGTAVKRHQVGRGKRRPAGADQIDDDELFFGQNDQSLGRSTLRLFDEEKVDDFGRQIEGHVLFVAPHNRHGETVAVVGSRHSTTECYHAFFIPSFKSAIQQGLVTENDF